MLTRIRHTLSSARLKTRSVCTRLAHKSSVLSLFPSRTPSSSDTLVATDIDTLDFTLTLAHTNVYSFGNLIEDMFADIFPVVAGNDEIYTIDDTAEYFGTKLVDDHCDVISSEHGEAVEVNAGAKVIASAKRYSILSVIFSDVDCFSMVSLEFSTDSDSSHALESNVDLEGQDSDVVTKNVTNNHSITKSIADDCSVASINSKRSETMAIADEAKAFFSGLSERDRSTLSIALCVVIEESVGKAVPRVEYVKVNCVVRMALRFRARGEMNITPEVLLMAAGINMLGIDDALDWLYPVIEKFCHMHLYNKGLGCGFA
ncbi:hypothetical protein GGI03_001986 [Coemansia sp. RSA 2337]|nr:hypothetical protein LPJ71_001335 [Coemansia sp. S17]KAJ2050781.1 hypothetical protein H4S04_002392 [Coemansia sp. S16]KAJ2075026.1 hypothetical protein GGH13_000912 [Coemansia sp. S155-1]KAJ2112537.1 hypothetical protein IW146_004542 [Coemansia sp. RSA 922]KAJ2466655.1 hypothetical protein GGI03_001986 [Coemansia sp. RSA 2337]